MQLDSARELKRALMDQFAPAEPTVRMRGLGEAARATSPQPLPSFALGVARGSKEDFKLAVRIQQRALQQGREIDLIKKRAKGEVDVRYIGAVAKRAVPWHRLLQRPLRPGCSVGHFRVTAGTLGAFVQPKGGGAVAILSNNHVLANENRAKKVTGSCNPARTTAGQIRRMAWPH